MNILQVNTYDLGGGAERITTDLLNGYRARGHTCYSAVRERKENNSFTFVIPNDVHRNRFTRACISLEKRFVRATIRGLPLACRILANVGEPGRWLKERRGFEDFEFPGTRDLLSLPDQKPDILHLHNLHGGYFDLRELPRLTAQIPCVITLHDEWMYTGHCASTLGCSRWQRGCGQCPDLTIPPAIPLDATSYNLHRKKQIYEQTELYVATPSQWLMNRALNSIFRRAVREWKVIPNGIDLSVFRPTSKSAARRELGLPHNAWISLFVGFNLGSNKFKDYETIRQAITQAGIRGNGYTHYLVCVGEAGEEQRHGSALIHFVNYQKNRNKLARYYQAADVYLHASHADNFPTAILEAMGCGTPVIATDVGGIAEQLEDGRTGLLVPAHDAAALLERVTCLQNNDVLRKAIGVAASHRAQKLFSLELMVDRYLNWYEEILRESERLVPSSRVSQDEPETTNRRHSVGLQ
jgi:glycosyltransferase involved in cell wall biosynthesis